MLCAVSGGRDSMALLHLLGVLGAEEGFQVAAAHFNHRLRPAADRDEAFVRSWCAGRGIPLFCGSGDVSAFARETGRSVEDAARELRYRFLEEAGRARKPAKKWEARKTRSPTECRMSDSLCFRGLTPRAFLCSVPTEPAGRPPR